MKTVVIIKLRFVARKF